MVIMEDSGKKGCDFESIVFFGILLIIRICFDSMKFFSMLIYDVSRLSADCFNVLFWLAVNYKEQLQGHVSILE